MSTLQVSNVHLESTGNNRIQYDGSNTFTIAAGDANVAVINSTSVSISTGVSIDGALSANSLTVNSADVVTVSATQTLTNKALSAPTISAGLTIDTETADWEGSVTLDPANGLYQEITLTEDVTSVTDNLVDGESVLLAINDGTAPGGFGITWPTITWISGDGVAPTLQTTGFTIINVWKSGSTLYGFASNGV